MLSGLASSLHPAPLQRAAARAPVPPSDVFTLDSPDKAIIFPGLNPLLFETLKFGVEIAGFGNSGVSAPLHLSAGQASGDVTYTLGFNTNQMQGDGSIDGQHFEETWTFGPQLKIDGKLGTVEEHLTATLADSKWHISGTVGQYGITQDITEWDKTANQGYSVDTTVGDRKSHDEYTQTRAGQDGKWQASMAGTDASASGQFAALQDRQRFTASGKNGTTAWTAGGDILFPANPNAPPSEG